MDNPTLLSNLDLQSATWKKLEQHYTERLAMLRAKNDSDSDPQRTSKLRGAIAEAKHFLALGEAPPVPATESDAPG